MKNDPIVASLLDQLSLVNDLKISVAPSAKSEGAEVQAQVSLGAQQLRLQIKASRYPSRLLVERLARESEHAGVAMLLVCPHIADALAADCRELGLNHADLNGRLYLKAPFLLIDRDPRDDSYRNPTPDVDVFSPKSSRLARAFLAEPWRERTQAQLEHETGVSRGLVSRVLQAYRDQGYVKVLPGHGRHAPTTYRLQRKDRLLDDWQASDEWRKRVNVHEYSLLAESEIEIALTAASAFGKENLAYTQWFAAALRHAHTTPPIVSAYLKDERLLASFNEREVDSGGNLWLLLPHDEGVFQFGQTKQGFQLVCDAQIYLDLQQVGHRGPEQAVALRAWEGFAS